MTKSLWWWDANRRLTVDTAGVVVAVPGSAVGFPHCVFDPLLCMLVKAVCNVLLWHPRFDVIALHLLDYLDSIFCHA